ncbi:dephospho-CoA kinase [Ekhidna lutea]|uniref:Dephospho-CoA kinase n=1 Tax=Ekhidna lutea TaxID=447679 RepID=A0A239IGR7_EKHLU|nr:dephospho-CoA kinase [Ekhidna lutea]SNS92860.1 dephospho-CoA kinase [Ekhidna lutea]
MAIKPPFIGITGGIGSGKSIVCKIFETLGATTYYADDRAKWLMENDDSLIYEIKELFGEEAYSESRLDRKFIAQKAFKDKNILDKLNSLVHPAVARDVEKWRKEHSGAKLLLKEAALLFETGSYKSLEKTVLVTAPEDIRVERVIARDTHRSKEDVQNIIEKQMSDHEKIQLADFVIINDGQQSLIKQVTELYKELVIA